MSDTKPNPPASIVKLTWQQKAIEVAKYHSSRCRDDDKHTLEETAKELNISTGHASHNLLLASWMKTHPRVEKFKNPSQALDYIRAKRKEQKMSYGLE